MESSGDMSFFSNNVEEPVQEGTVNGVDAENEVVMDYLSHVFWDSL